MSIHRVEVENHQKNIIQRKTERATKYPDREASVETESRLRSVQDRMTGEPNEPLIQSAATDNAQKPMYDFLSALSQ